MWLYFLIFGIALILLGVGFMLATHFTSVHQAGLKERCVVAAEAELVDTTERTTEFSESIEISYHGSYTFVTEDGVRVTAENKVGYGAPDQVPGPVVGILYNPNNIGEFILPEEQASIANSSILPGLRRGGIAMLAIGVALLVAAVVLLVV